MDNTMMKGKKRVKGRVKGTVLFTVVMVMMVCVLFLMSTLILTTSANRRSYYTYYQSQAQYAAQAALDAITNKAYAEQSFGDFVDGVTGEDKIYVTFAGDSALGLNATGQLSGTINQGQGNVNNTVECTITRLPEYDYVWDDARNAVIPRTSWKISATAYVGVGENQRSYTAVNYIYKNIPDVQVDTARQDQIRWSYWEYESNTGSSSMGTGQKYEINKTQKTLTNAVYSLSTTGTNNNVNSFGPQYSGMSLFPDGRIKYNTSTNKAEITNETRRIGNVVMINNVYGKNGVEYQFQRAGEGAVFFGNYYAAERTSAWYSTVPAAAQPTATDKWDYKADINYLYVDGTIDNTGLYTVNVGCKSNGDKGTMPVNLYAGAINNTGNNGIKIFGDAYLYDPALDTVISGNSASPLYTFVNQNVEKTGDSKVTKLGGNLVCNNKTLTLGGNGAVTIDGDLIFTNPSGTLNFGNNVTVKGTIVCAGTVTGTAKNATGGNAAVVTDLTAWVDPGYGTTVYTSNTPAGYNFNTFPYAYRLDEIFEKYYRYDLKVLSTSATHTDDEAIATGLDDLMKESIAAGHNWKWKLLTGQNTDNAGNTTTVSYWVPYTTPHTPANAFIDAFEPQTSDNAIANLDPYMTSVAAFRTKYSTNTKNYTLATLTQKNVSFPVHKADTTLETKTIKCAVVHEDCEIDLSNYNTSTNIFLDPTNNGTNKSLHVVFKGELSNAEIRIFTNNTGRFDSETADTYTIRPFEVIRDDSKKGTSDYFRYNNMEYAGNGEIEIFLDPSFKVNSNAFMVFPTGAYNQVNSKVYDVTQNPIYPGLPNHMLTPPKEIEWTEAWWTLKNNNDPETYKYELVPNAVIFGEANKTYFAQQGLYLWAQTILPKSILNYQNSGTSINETSSITYRAEYNSTPQKGGMKGETTSVRVNNFGVMVCKDLAASANDVVVVSILDENRPVEVSSGSEPVQGDPVWTEKAGTGDSASIIKTSTPDYVSNDHQGAN